MLPNRSNLCSVQHTLLGSRAPEEGPGREQHVLTGQQGFRVWRLHLRRSTLLNVTCPVPLGCASPSTTPRAFLQLVNFRGFGTPKPLPQPASQGPVPPPASRSQPRAQGFPLVTVLGSDSGFSLALYMVSPAAHSSGRKGKDGQTPALSRTGLSGTSALPSVPV